MATFDPPTKKKKKNLSISFSFPNWKNCNISTKTNRLLIHFENHSYRPNSKSIGIRYFKNNVILKHQKITLFILIHHLIVHPTSHLLF